MATTLPDLDHPVRSALVRGNVLDRKQVEQATIRLLRDLGVPAKSGVLAAEHLCMTRRGVHPAGAATLTVATRGRLWQDCGARSEYLQLTGRPGRTA